MEARAARATNARPAIDYRAQCVFTYIYMYTHGGDVNSLFPMAILLFFSLGDILLYAYNIYVYVCRVAIGRC